METFQRKKMNIAIAGGGTAGHIYPALAVANKLKGNDIIFIGPKSDVDSSLVKKDGIKYFGISSGKLRRYFDWNNFIDPFRIKLGIFQAISILRSNKINVLFCKGGYASIAPAIAAKTLRIPIVLHESDSVPGIANRFIGKFAKKICLGFSDAAQYFKTTKVVISGNPVRSEFTDNLEMNIQTVKNKLGINPNLPCVLVIGGSQGAVALNEAVAINLEKILGKFNLMHISGARDYTSVKEKKGMLSEDLSKRYFVFEFVKEELPAMMEMADVIVSRSGAGVLSEIAMLGKPSILVPLPKSAQDHQRKNAQVFASAKAGIVVEQEDLQNKIAEILNTLLEDKETLRIMGENARKLAHLDAAKQIADIILSSLRGTK